MNEEIRSAMETIEKSFGFHTHNPSLDLNEPQRTKEGVVKHEFKLHPDSLRDFFAGLAMQDLIPRDNYDNMPATAKLAYQYADAMLAARKPKEE